MKSTLPGRQGYTILQKSVLVMSVFSLTTFLTYGATLTEGGLLKSTPYQSRSATADATLERLTNGSGATILNGVITRVQ